MGRKARKLRKSLAEESRYGNRRSHRVDEREGTSESNSTGTVGIHAISERRSSLNREETTRETTRETDRETDRGTEIMDLSATDLYPVVQDLTDAEYGCCSSAMVFGSFSLQQLASPNATPLASSSSHGKRNVRLSPRSVLDRENSLVALPNNDRAHQEQEFPLTVRRRDRLYDRFEDNFVLTRQVRWDLFRDASSLAYRPPC